MEKPVTLKTQYPGVGEPGKMMSLENTYKCFGRVEEAHNKDTFIFEADKRKLANVYALIISIRGRGKEHLTHSSEVCRRLGVGNEQDKTLRGSLSYCASVDSLKRTIIVTSSEYCKSWQSIEEEEVG